jgi:hypothetical protein
MAVMRRRNRLVSFRVSEQEYETLQNSTITEGARSISDFARAALSEVLDAPKPNTEPVETTSGFQSAAERLVVTMGELNQVISRLTLLVQDLAETGRRR